MFYEMDHYHHWSTWKERFEHHNLWLEPRNGALSLRAIVTKLIKNIEDFWHLLTNTSFTLYCINYVKPGICIYLLFCGSQFQFDHHPSENGKPADFSLNHDLCCDE